MCKKKNKKEKKQKCFWKFDFAHILGMVKGFSGMWPPLHLHCKLGAIHIRHHGAKNGNFFLPVNILTVLCMPSFSSHYRVSWHNGVGIMEVILYHIRAHGYLKDKSGNCCLCYVEMSKQARIVRHILANTYSRTYLTENWPFLVATTCDSFISSLITRNYGHMTSHDITGWLDNLMATITMPQAE